MIGDDAVAEFSPPPFCLGPVSFNRRGDEVWEQVRIVIIVLCPARSRLVALEAHARINLKAWAVQPDDHRHGRFILQ